MPVKHCIMCETRYELPRDVYKYVHHKEPFICSKGCLYDWVTGHIRTQEHDWRTKYPYPGFVTDGLHTVYSQEYDTWFGSKYELQVAYWLTLRALQWHHEEIGFPLGRQRYTPDFYLPEYDVFFEVKGAWVQGKRKKMDLFRELYPDVELIVVPWLLAAEFDQVPVKEQLCHFVRC